MQALPHCIYNGHSVADLNSFYVTVDTKGSLSAS